MAGQGGIHLAASVLLRQALQAGTVYVDTLMVFQQTGPGPRTVRVRIVRNRRGKYQWKTEKGTAGRWWHSESIDAQRDVVSTYGRDIEITDEKGRVRYVP